MSRFTRERQIAFIQEFLGGVGVIEDWQTDQAVIPVRFFNLKIDLDTRRGDIGNLFSQELGRLATRIIDMRKAFDQARTTTRFPGGFGGGQDDQNADEDDDD